MQIVHGGAGCGIGGGYTKKDDISQSQPCIPSFAPSEGANERLIRPIQFFSSFLGFVVPWRWQALVLLHFLNLSNFGFQLFVRCRYNTAWTWRSDPCGRGRCLFFFALSIKPSLVCFISRSQRATSIEHARTAVEPQVSSKKKTRKKKKKRQVSDGYESDE